MSFKKKNIISITLVLVLILGSFVLGRATSAHTMEQGGNESFVWEDEQGNLRQYLHPETRQPITPEESANFNSTISELVCSENHAAMVYIPEGATSTQIWLVEYFGGLYRAAPTIEELTYIGYYLASRLVFSNTVEWFDDFFGKGSAYAIMTGQDFRTLFALLHYPMFYNIIEVENFEAWMTYIFGETAMNELHEMPIYPPIGISQIVGTRLARFEHMLKQLVVDVRDIVVTPDMLLDLTLSHEETLLRGFIIIDGNIHNIYGELLIALDEDGLMACGTRISANFQVYTPRRS